MRALLYAEEGRELAFLKRGLDQQVIAVDATADMKAVISLAMANDYDVLLLMAQVGHVEASFLCTKLRQLKLATPIIILSRSDTVEERIEGLDSGADDYVSRPFSFSELMARIRAVVRRKDFVQLPKLQICDLTIDCNRRQVVRNGRPIALSPKQFRLLEFLARKQGKVVSRYDILENVWGSSDFLFSNVVDVHMSHLRAKIDRGFDRPLIKTIRGGGYVLENLEV